MADDGGVGRQQAEEGGAQRPVGNGEDGGDGPADAEQPADHRAQAAQVARPVEPSAEGLAGVGKAVHDVAEEHEQLHQQRVGCQRQGPLRGSGRGEIEIDGHETERAQEDVEIEPEEAPQPAQQTAEAGRVAAEHAPVIAPEQDEGDDEARPLRHDRARGHATDAPPQPDDKQERDEDVRHVLQDGYQHGQPRGLHAHVPARQPVEAQHGRRPPHAYIIIR